MSKTVGLIEAVNSGKRFRIVGSSSWWNKFTKYSGISLTFDQINSQFELEEKTITITESDFDKICIKNTGNYICVGAMDYLKKELGF